MAESIQDVFKAREEFIGHIENDIKKAGQALEATTKEVQALQKTITDVKALGKSPEHEALIPLAKNVYMKGRIVHTGEYYVKKPASPDSYLILKTLEQTLDSIQNEVKLKEKDIENIEYSNYQLHERIKLLRGESDEASQDDELPKEIKSDKGVAVRMGEFYEILEFEDD